MKNNDITELKTHLQQQEVKLQQAYLLLGKKAQECFEDLSEPVNALVDDIVKTKQKIAKLEQDTNYYI